MTARTTMKDVAEAAGVGLMTVSRVVSGAAGVSPATAAKVERAVRELGYQRDDIARNLRAKDRATSTIGLVVDDLANPFYAILARAVEDEAHRRGHLVLVGSTNNELKREREVVSAFCSRQVDGLIMVPTAGNHAFLKAQIKAGTRVVCVDRPAPGLDVDTVTVDNHAGARHGVDHLIDHGHTRIAFLGDRSDIWTQQQRLAGYQDALSSHGIQGDPQLIRQELRTKAAAAAAVVEVMAQPNPPTALFASNDLIAIGAMEGLGQAGTAASSRVALVGFDDFPLADMLSPPVTVVSQDPAALGASAATLLFARIHGDTSPPRSVVLLTRFLVRGSGERRPISRRSTSRKSAEPASK